MWESLRGERLFITGGTGFVGCWLLETFCWANRRLRLRAAAEVLTRDPAAFARKAPHLARDDALSFLIGDVRTFDAPKNGFGFCVHAATSPGSADSPRGHLELLEAITAGTRRTLEAAASAKASRLLFISSGAVYGQQPADVSRIPEEYRGAPDPLDPRSAYAEGKRVAELTCKLYEDSRALDVPVARCFTFVGPYLPLNAHYAAGNFIRDRLAGCPIRVLSDGAARRSYLYAADMAIWLWTLLCKGASGRAYNVGSEHELSIVGLAHTVAASGMAQPCEVRLAKSPETGTLPARYVPSTRRIAAELGLEPIVLLPEAIEKTVRWHQHVSASGSGR